MDTTTSAVATVVITAAGRWAQNKPFSMKLVVALLILALSLSALESANEQLAKKFAVLILVAALLANVIPITKKMGFTK
jgi:hypothetical protein